jgi:hypothetical protein
MVVVDDQSGIDTRSTAELLRHHGAPIALAILPSGRVETVLRRPAPACGLAFIRNLHDRPDYQWVARTANFDFVAASLAQEEDHPQSAETIAVAGMNTLSQAIATQAGYRVLPVKSVAQALPLLKAGRAAIFVGARQEVEKVATAGRTPLRIERVLAHGEAWLACNPFVERPDIDRIAAAWKQAVDSGELREAYARSGAESMYPDP